jgi:hypothetical protein
MARKVKASCLVYSHLMRLYPRELRERFGAEMLAVFEEMVCEAVERRNAMGLFSIWWSAVRELALVAAPARLWETSVIASALSLLVASTEIVVFFRYVN